MPVNPDMNKLKKLPACCKCHILNRALNIVSAPNLDLIKLPEALKSLADQYSHWCRNYKMQGSDIVGLQLMLIKEASNYTVSKLNPKTLYRIFKLFDLFSINYTQEGHIPEGLDFDSYQPFVLKNFSKRIKPGGV